MNRDSLAKIDIIGNAREGYTFIVRMCSIAISQEFFKDLNIALDDIEILRKARNINGTLKAVIFKSELPSIFLAGADLVEMSSYIDNNKKLSEIIDTGHNTFNRIEKLDVPTIAAINGACLGGGFELALACDYRVATYSKSTKIGLPEVNLGILPAWGGTTRLPRLIGLIKTLKVILGGSPNPPKLAYKLGLVDNLVHEENLEKWAIDFAKLAKKKREKKMFFRRLMNPVIFNKAVKSVLSKTKGNYPAPMKIIDTLRKTYEVSAEESYALEKKAFLELVKSSQCKNLLRIFFLQERAKKQRYKSIKVSYNSPLQTCVVGAGTMGAGIAQWISSRGMSVLLKDVDQAAVANGLKLISDLFVSGVRGHKLDRPTARDGLARITTTTNDVPLKNHDLIIEAIVENLEIKKTVLKQLEEAAGPNTILATNTSALSIDDMAEVLDRPENFVGIHFFNPVHKMKLVEIVAGSKTSDDTIARAVRFVQNISKLPVIVKDSPGFVVNRILMPYLIEAARHYQNGIEPIQIDRNLVKWGMPMGPFRLMDEIGLDVCLHVANDLSQRAGLTIPDILAKMVSDGKLGKKSGEGFYKYKKGKSVKVRSGKINITELNNSTAILTSSMINEASKVLEENIALDADDIDFAMIMGTGFAPFKGGPLKYKETL